MAALSEMTEAEKYLVDDDPDLIRAGAMTGSIRWLEMYRIYLLRDRLERAKSRKERTEIVNRWGFTLGVTPAVLLKHLKWARLIRLKDLTMVFAEDDIPEQEWTQRVGITHLATIARARHQDTDLGLSSPELAKWAKRVYHANLSVAELEQMLRDTDLLPPKESSGTAPLPAGTPATACDLLEHTARRLREQHRDIDLSGMLAKRPTNKPIKAVELLEYLADLIEQKHPGAEFKIGEAGSREQGQ